MHLKYTFETMSIDDLIFAVPVGNDNGEIHVVRLNSTGEVIFNLLKEETTEEKIIEYLLEQYDVPKSKATDDVQRCIGVLRRKGLVVE